MISGGGRGFYRTSRSWCRIGLVTFGWSGFWEITAELVACVVTPAARCSCAKRPESRAGSGRRGRGSDFGEGGRLHSWGWGPLTKSILIELIRRLVRPILGISRELVDNWRVKCGQLCV